MGLRIPRNLVEFILLGPEDDRRQLQDSPILGDVWVEFAKRPAERLELLISPYKEQAAAVTAPALRGAVLKHNPAEQTNIAYLQGIVAASLTFREVIQFLVPLTYWWSESRIADVMKKYLTDETTLAESLRETRKEAEKWLSDTSDASMRDF